MIVIFSNAVWPFLSVLLICVGCATEHQSDRPEEALSLTAASAQAIISESRNRLLALDSNETCYDEDLPAGEEEGPTSCWGRFTPPEEVIVLVNSSPILPFRDDADATTVALVSGDSLRISIVNGSRDTLEHALFEILLPTSSAMILSGTSWVRRDYGHYAHSGDAERLSDLGSVPPEDLIGNPIGIHEVEPLRIERANPNRHRVVFTITTTNRPTVEREFVLNISGQESELQN